MLGFSTLSTKSKLAIVILVVSLGSILSVGYLALSRSRAMIQQASLEQLDSVRSLRAGQIESYFENILSQVKTLTEDDMIVAAMVRFNQSFSKLNNVLIPEDWNAEIRTYYREEFIPRLSENIGGDPTFPVYSPRRQAARYLQYHYLIANPNPIGKKDDLIAAQDGSEYSKIHARYHQRLRNLIKEFGYYDLFLIRVVPP